MNPPCGPDDKKRSTSLIRFSTHKLTIYLKYTKRVLTQKKGFQILLDLYLNAVHPLPHISSCCSCAYRGRALDPNEGSKQGLVEWGEKDLKKGLFFTEANEKKEREADETGQC